MPPALVVESSDVVEDHRAGLSGVVSGGGMGGLDDVAVGRFKSVSGEGAGELIAAGDIDFETTVAAFLLTGFEGIAVLFEFLHLSGIGNGQSKAFADANLFTRREVASDTPALSEMVYKVGFSMKLI